MKSLIELQNGLIASGEWDRHTDCVNRLIQINNNNIVSCSLDKTSRIWDIKTNQSIGILHEHQNGIYYISKLQNGNIISASEDMTMQIGVVDNRKCVDTLKRHDGGVLVLFK